MDNGKLDLQDGEFAGCPREHEEEENAYRKAYRRADVACGKYEHAVPSAH